MIRIRVVCSLVFGLGLMASGAALLYAEDGSPTAAQKDRAAAREIEAADAADVEAQVDEAVLGHGAGEHHEAGGHGEPNNNPLEFKTDLALFTGVVFVVLLLVLWKFAWGPISSALDKREQSVAMQISEAAANNEEAKRLLAQYGEKLDRAKEDVRGILDQARRDAEGVGREIVEAAKQEAKTENQRAVREIDAAKTAALQELAQRSANMAVELAGKIVKSELRAADHAQLVEQAVSQFAAGGALSKPR